MSRCRVLPSLLRHGISGISVEVLHLVSSEPEHLPVPLKPQCHCSALNPTASLWRGLWTLAQDIFNHPCRKTHGESSMHFGLSATTPFPQVTCLANSNLYSRPKSHYCLLSSRGAIMLFLDTSLYLEAILGRGRAGLVMAPPCVISCPPVPINYFLL